MSEHTPGKVTVCDLELVDESGRSITNHNIEQCMVNVKHAADCWNACAGMDDPEKDISEMRATIAQIESLFKSPDRVIREANLYLDVKAVCDTADSALITNGELQSKLGGYESPLLGINPEAVPEVLQIVNYIAKMPDGYEIRDMMALQEKARAALAKAGAKQ